jgi:hypothetical protein
VTTATILWRRLDVPGHDACRLERDAAGWTLDGAAVFVEDGVPSRLAYRVRCDAAWRSERGSVRGWIGGRAVEIDVARTAEGEWTLNAVPIPGPDGCDHLDFGFTPATNLFQIRHASLSVGEAADVPAAWLAVSSGTLEVLRQRYERRSETTYWYEAPRFGYAALLEAGAEGFIRRYPGLWEAEA